MEKAVLPSDEHKIKKYCAELIEGKFYCYYNQKTKDDYRNICDFFDIISKRLEDVGYILTKSEQDKTIFLETQPELPSKYQNLNILKSKVILYLTKKFLSDIKNINTGATVYYKWNEMLKDLQDICNNNKEKCEIIDTLWMLKNLNIIDVNATKKFLKDNDENDQITISIFPAIKHVCNFNALSRVEEKLETYNITRQSITEDSEEDEDDE